MMRALRAPAVLALALLIASGAALAQSDIQTGTLKGTVVDGDGNALPGVTVTATKTATGFVRVGVTDAGGRYQIRQVPSGTYTLRAEIEGFAPYERRGIEVSVGDELDVDFQLRLESISEEIIVTSEAPILETTKSSLTASINETAIQTLPLNGRDFKDLIALTPQAVEVGSERVSINGARGIMNSFNIDGADSNSSFFGEERGGTRPAFTYSQAAIKEFQVVRSSYNARFGNAAGGIINAVTKSGTNEFRGGAFFYTQDDSLVKDQDALGREISTFDRDQMGLDIGGPIIRDKVHFFFAWDNSERTEDFPRAADDSGFLDDPANLAAWNAKLQSLGIDPATEFDYNFTNDNDVLLGRIDWAVNDSHQFWIRTNYSDQDGINLTDTRFSTTGRSANGFEKNSFTSSVASLNSVFSTSSFNEAIVQYSTEDRPRAANVTSAPEINIGFFDAVIGQNNFLPNFLTEDKLQIQDNFTHFVGEHTIKAGVDYSDISFDDGFCRFCGGQYLFFGFDDFLADDPFRYTQAFSPTNGVVNYDTEFLAVYASDEWRVRDNLTLEFGVRVDSQNNPTPQVSNPLEPLTAQIPDDTNIAPRFGFAWDIGGDGKSMVRGGVGYFYSPTPSLLVANALLTNGVLVNRVQLDAGDPGFPTFPNRIPDAGALPTLTPDIFVFDPDFENPETMRMSIGYERAIRDDFSIGLDLVYSESRNFERKRNINQDPTPVGFTSDGRPIYDRGNKINPNFGKVMQFVSDAKAQYTSAAITARKRFSHNWELLASYTYANSKDHDTNERSVSSSSSGWPSDFFNLDQDWGYSDYDVRNRVVISGTYIAPWDVSISGIFRWRDALPLNPMAASDLNGDGFNRDRPGPDEGFPALLRRNSFRGGAFQTLDVRVSKTFTFGNRHELELLVESFNLLDSDNFSVFENEILDRNGNLTADFDQPQTAGKPRQYQLGLRYRF